MREARRALFLALTLLAAIAHAESPAAPRPVVVPLLAQSKFAELDEKLSSLAAARDTCTFESCALSDALSDLSQAIDADETLQPFLEAWTKTSKLFFAWYITGVDRIDRAWDARGRGYASTVPADAWPRFRGLLASADDAFGKAQKLDPKAPEPAIARVQLALYRTGDLAEVKRAFDAAVAIDPSNFAAHEAARVALTGKWLGSDAAQMEFARESLRRQPKSPELGLLVLRAHQELSRDVGDPRQYWGDPAVWAEASAVLENYLLAHPDSPWAHNTLAYLAWVTKKKPVLARELRLIGADWMPSVWRNNRSVFEAARYWALGEKEFIASPAAPAQ
jgi:tetratricopeptide (TPR) repeat protein